LSHISALFGHCKVHQVAKYSEVGMFRKLLLQLLLPLKILWFHMVNYDQKKVLYNLLNYSKSCDRRHTVLYSDSLDTNWSKLGRAWVVPQLWPVRCTLLSLYFQLEKTTFRCSVKTTDIFRYNTDDVCALNFALQIRYNKHIRNESLHCK